MKNKLSLPCPKCTSLDNVVWKEDFLDEFEQSRGASYTCTVCNLLYAVHLGPIEKQEA